MRTHRPVNLVVAALAVISQTARNLAFKSQSPDSFLSRTISNSDPPPHRRDRNRPPALVAHRVSLGPSYGERLCGLRWAADPRPSPFCSPTQPQGPNPGGQVTRPRVLPPFKEWSRAFRTLGAMMCKSDPLLRIVPATSLDHVYRPNRLSFYVTEYPPMVLCLPANLFF